MKSIFIILIIILFSISSFGAIETISFNSKFDKSSSDIQTFNSYNGFKTYKPAKSIKYKNSYLRDNSLRDKKEYQDYYREYINNRNKNKILQSQVKIKSEQSFKISPPRKTQYYEYKQDYNSKNKYKIQYFKSKSLIFSNTQSYNYNYFN